MTSTTQQAPEAAQPETSVLAGVDICRDLARLATEARSEAIFFRSALRAIATHFHAPFAVVTLHRSTSSLDDSVSDESENADLWRRVGEAAMLECISSHHSIARLYRVKGTDQGVAALAVSVGGASDETFGATALVTGCDDRQVATAHLAELRALIALAVTEYSRALADRHQDQQQTDAAARGVAKASKFSSVHELAFHLTNNLKNKLGGNQVALGIAQRQTVRLISVSGLDRVHARSPGTLRIRQAMEECLDMGEPIGYQHNQVWSDESDAVQYRLHQRWHHDTGSAVASIPVFDGDSCVAVVSIQRDESEPFDTEELTKTAAKLAPYGPSITLIQRASEGLAAHTTRRVRQSVVPLLSRGAWGRKVAAVAAVLGLVWFCVGTIPYTLSVPSVVTARQLHHFSAPFEGKIASCHVRPGDRVRVGQTLAEMDTEDLQLEAQRLMADIAAARLETARAYEKSHAADAAQANARLGAMQARLEITRNRIGRARIIAPADGRIISGDLTQRIGETVPMGHPLMQLAPAGVKSIELRIPEQMVVDVARGHRGVFTSNARPDAPIGCQIRTVHASSGQIEGENVFVAEADLTDDRPWTLVGMEGVARIDAGQRRVWWVALHRAINATRLGLGV